MRNSIAVIAIVCLGMSSIGLAEDYYRTGGSGLWSDSAEWRDPADNPGVPGTGDRAIFNNVSNISVELDANVTVGTLEVRDYVRLNPVRAAGGTTPTPTLEIETSIEWRSTYAADSQIWVPVIGDGAINMIAGSLDLTSDDNTINGAVTVGGSGQAAWLTLRSLGDGTITVLADGHCRLSGQSSNPYVWNNDITLHGGTLLGDTNQGGRRKNQEVAGMLTVLSDSRIDTAGNTAGATDVWLTGEITGSGKIIKGGGPADLELDALDTSGWSGGLEVVSGRAVVHNADTLGTGDVLAKDSGTLHLLVAPTAVAGQRFRAEPGGNIVLADPSSAPFSMDVDVAGGSLAPNGPDQELSGKVTLYGDFNVAMSWSGNHKDLTLSGTVAESGGSYALTKATGTGRLVLSHANSYSGGTNVFGGGLTAAAVGSLGTGPVVVGGEKVRVENGTFASGWLRTDADGSLDSAASVTVKEDGVIEYNSAETKVVTVEAGAAVRKAGGGMVFHYSGPSKNVDLAAGAILDSAVTELPGLAELSTGDGGYGLYYGIRSSSGDTTEYAFGPGSGDKEIFRGLAALGNGRLGFSNDYGSKLVFRGTVSSTAGDLEFLSQAGTQMKIQGATLNGDVVNLRGNGEFQLADALGGTFTTINSYARYVDLDNTPLAGKTLNVKDGSVLVLPRGTSSGEGVFPTGGWNDHNAMDGATVNVEGGAIMRVGAALTSTSGMLNLRSGSGLYLRTPDAAYMGAQPYAIEDGAQVWVQTYQLPAAGVPMIGAGKVDYVIGGRENNTRHGDGIMIIGDDRRLTFTPGNHSSITVMHAGGSGYIGLDAANGGSRIRIAAPYEDGNGRLKVQAVVDLDLDGVPGGEAGKLLVGGEGEFTTFNSEASGWTAISQNGQVMLDNTGNNIGSVDVVAGTFMTKNNASLGGAVEVNLIGGDFVMDYNNPSLTTMIKGAGSVQVGSSGTSKLTLAVTETGAAGFAPTGVLAVSGHVDLLGTSGANPANPSLEVHVTGAGGVAGDDFGQVAVTGNVDVLDLDTVVSLPVPSVHLKPSELGDMRILTSAALTSDTLNLIVGETLGARPGDDHWVLDPGVTALENDGSNLVLHGSALIWDAVPGDADLDGRVTIADLTILADHYGQSAGVNWMSADFDLDGRVTIADLTILADHYGDTRGGVGGVGGAAVPEPATLTLLAFAGTALLRRRRR